MSTAVVANPYHIPPEPGRMSAIFLAAVMHMALLAFFWIGIDWRSETPLAVEAEVWDIKIREAAPKAEEARERVAPPPPAPAPVKKVEEDTPPPPKVDIALEQEKKRKQEQLEDKKRAEKLALEKQQREDALQKERDEKLAKELEKKKLAAEKLRKEAAEQAARDKLRAEEMRRIAGGATSLSGGTGEVVRSTGPRGDPSYKAAIMAKIKSNIAYAGARDIPSNPQAEYKILLLPSGEVLNKEKIRSSGIPAFDLAVENAIIKSSPLPRKKDGTVERELTITFNLKD